jgi:putative redox protein
MEYTVDAVHQEGLRFVAKAGSHSVTTDYPLTPGEVGTGARPLELLLASLASCAGGALVALLRHAGQPVGGLRVSARGQRRSEHPTVFTQIDLEFVLCGAVDRVVVEKAIAQAEEHICPVWAMLKPGTPISSTLRIEGS